MAVSWNWLDFLLPPAWLAYRRMWGWLAGLIGLVIGLTVLEELADIDLGNSIGTGISIATAMYGKKLVIQKAAAAAAEADAQSLFGEQRVEFLAGMGGVSKVGAWLVGVIYVGLIGLMIWAALAGR